MTSLRAAVVAARDRLQAVGIDEPQIEAELLLRYALEVVAPDRERVSRTALYSRWSETLTAPVEAVYAAFLARRLSHEPSAYILGRRAFWGLEFCVTPAVLIPRPETEGLVEIVLREVGSMTRRTPLRIADGGAGCGAIAIALASELPAAEVYACDVSREALAVATENARRLGVSRRISFCHGHLLAPLNDYVDFIVANLPYVTKEDWSRLAPELRDHEPRLALDGGADGLDLVRALVLQAPRYLRPGGCIALEIGETQAEALGSFVHEMLPGATWQVEKDFAGKDRYLLIRPATSELLAAARHFSAKMP